MKKRATDIPCPCRAQGSAPLAYAQCCQPWHQGLARGVHADTPEQLMRSRYSAYALATPNSPQGHAMLDYLQATWHASSVPGDLELSPMQWLGLQVLHSQQSGAAGVVEFVAHYKVDGKAQQLHEISRFTRVDAAPGAAGQATDAPPGRWLYIDGQVSDGQASEQ